MCMRAQLPQLHNLEGDCVFLFYSFILYYFILFGRKVALAAECIGNEEIKHLAMMTPASSRRELVFLFLSTL